MAKLLREGYLQARMQHAIANTRLAVLLLLVIGIYLVFALMFALVYYKMGLLEPSSSTRHAPDFIGCLYFSIITQSTVGFGDYVPIESRIAHIVVSGHVVVSTILLAIGGSVIVYRFLKPLAISIEFDPYAMFNPDTGSLQVRFRNQFQSPITRLTASMYLRSWFDDLGTSGMFRTLDIRVRRNVFPRLFERGVVRLNSCPTTSSQFEFSSRSTETGAIIEFHPSMMKDGAQLIVFVSGDTTDHQSTVTADHMYLNDEVRCGVFQDTGGRPEMSRKEAEYKRVRAWGKHHETLSSKCSTCRFTDSCALPTRQRSDIADSS